MDNELGAFNAIVLRQTWLFIVNRLGLQSGPILREQESTLRLDYEIDNIADRRTLGSKSMSWIWSKSFVRAWNDLSITWKELMRRIRTLVLDARWTSLWAWWVLFLRRRPISSVDFVERRKIS